MNIGGRSYYPESAGEARRLLVNAGSGQSVMAGCVQVNASVHARNSDWPLDPNRSARWAARYLRMHYENTGSWPDAIRRWNGGSPGSVNKLLCRVEAKLQVVSPGSAVLAGTGCSRNNMARARRDGAALLEMAEAQD